jgi:hypothetical protein
MGDIQVQETSQILEQQLEMFRKKFLDPRVARDFKGWNGKTMQYLFTDTGDRFIIRFADGVPGPAERGTAEKAEIQYELATETFFALARKEITGLRAYAQGKVKLRASMPDMLKLQRIDSI